MTEIDTDKLRALDEAATTGDLSTAERHIKHEHIECPICQGDGEVLATDYCNIDGKALGVQFYGIGNEFGAHEALWTYLRHSVPAILAMAEENKRMREALEEIAAFRAKELERFHQADDRKDAKGFNRAGRYAANIAIRALRSGERGS